MDLYLTPSWQCFPLITKGIVGSSHFRWQQLMFLCESYVFKATKIKLVQSEEWSGRFSWKSGAYFSARLFMLQAPLAKLSLTIIKAEKSNSGSNLTLWILRFGWEQHPLPEAPWPNHHSSVNSSHSKGEAQMWMVHLWARSLCRHLVAFEMPWGIWNIRGRLADMIKGLRQDLCPSARAAGGQAGYSGHLKWQLTTMCGQVNQVLGLHSCLSQSPLWVGKYLITVNIPLSPVKRQHKHVLSTLPWAGGKMAMMQDIKVYGQEI